MQRCDLGTVDDEAQIGHLALDPAKFDGTIVQPLLDLGKLGPRPDHRRAGVVPALGIEAAVQLGKFAGIGEGRAIAVVQIAFARQPFGQDHVMALQLDMVIANLFHLVLNDRRAVDQEAGRDQHALDEDRMARRHAQIARRHSLAERTGTNADGMDFPRPRMARRRWREVASHFTARTIPLAVRIWSPGARSSTTRSPSAVRISVPAAKQAKPRDANGSAPL
jgi:hypothetical protein